VQHNASTGGIPEELLILPPGAIQSCHLIRSGLDCQIPLSEAAWRLQLEKQAVRCSLPLIRSEWQIRDNFSDPCRAATHCSDAGTTFFDPSHSIADSDTN